LHRLIFQEGRIKKAVQVALTPPFPEPACEGPALKVDGRASNKYLSFGVIRMKKPVSKKKKAAGKVVKRKSGGAKSPRRKAFHEKRKKFAGKLRKKSKNSPLFFLKEILKGNPWSKEEEILKSVKKNKYTAVRSGHGVGKTYSAAMAALWFLLCHPHSIVITTAPTWRQVKKLLWGEIRKAFRRFDAHYALRKQPALLETELRLDDDWYALGVSTDEPERFQGFHAKYLLIVIDEAPGVDRDIYESCISLMTGRNSKMLAIGNPLSPSGWFFEAFQSELWNKIHISCFDCPNVRQESGIRKQESRNREKSPNPNRYILNPELPYPKLVTLAWIEDRKREWGEDSPIYQSRVLGEFPQEGEDTLIPLSWLEQGERIRSQGAENREDEPLNPIVMGVDVARFGSDETVFLIRDTRHVMEVASFRRKSTMETCGRVIHLAGKFSILPENIKIDDAGVGGGVVDRLREQGWNVGAVNFGSAAGDSEHFLNLRAELFWRVREVLNPENTEPQAPARAAPDKTKQAPPFFIGGKFRKLQGQLSALKYYFSSDGRIKIEPKEAYRKRMGESPDHADALAISFAMPEEKPGLRIF